MAVFGTGANTPDIKRTANPVVMSADIMAGDIIKRGNYKSITSTTPKIDLIAERIGAEI